MTPVPPTTLIPWDHQAIIHEALASLRLSDTDVDAQRVASYVPAVCDVIERYVDPYQAMDAVPDALVRAAAFVTCEQFRRKDAPFGQGQGWSPDDGGPVFLSPDWLTGVRYMLLPYKQGWGVA